MLVEWVATDLMQTVPGTVLEVVEETRIGKERSRAPGRRMETVWNETGRAWKKKSSVHRWWVARGGRFRNG